MKEPIRFAGLDLHTDDLSVPNSSLALCAGVECENGTLRPSFLSYSTLDFPPISSASGDNIHPELVYIHESASYRHYICRYPDAERIAYGFYYDPDGGGLSFFKIESLYSLPSAPVQIQHVGNTLVFNIDGEIHYILFKQDANSYGYKYLGQKPPFVELQFGTTEQVIHNEIDSDLWEDLRTRKEGVVPKKIFFRHDKTVIDKASNLLETYRDESNIYTMQVKQENQSAFTEAVKAFLNKANDFLAREGCFYAPFMVRYAYRMYDGKTLIMHSAPVYIPVSDNALSQYDLSIVNLQTYIGPNDVPIASLIKTYNNIVVDIVDNSGSAEDKNGGLCFVYQPGNVRLEYRVLNHDKYNELKNDWGDIIKSIDIFISAPLVNWDQSQTIKEIDLRSPTSTLILGDYTSIYLTSDQMPGFWVDSKSRSLTHSVKLPTYDNLSHEERVRQLSTFFKLHSVNLKEDSLPTLMTKVPYKNGILPIITTQEQMVDDYLSHNLISGRRTFVYNHRFHIGDITEKLFNGFSSNLLLPYWTTVDSKNEGNVDYTSLNTYRVKQISVQLSTADGTKYVQAAPAAISQWQYLCRVMPSYFFYPDPRAVGMTIQVEDIQVEDRYFNLALTECPGLNGAAWYGYLSAVGLEDTAKFAGSPDNEVYQPSKLYVAPIDNPFVFEPSGIMTVGVGRILGMAVATRAISPGQYGAFPLTVFCSDGIWMFSVDKEGRYADQSYLSSEVVSNPESITQLDQSVVFSTSRAFNKLYQDTAENFSLPLEGRRFDPSKYRHMENFMAVPDTGDESTHPDKHAWTYLANEEGCQRTTPVADVVNSRVLYDVVNYRLLFVPESNTGDYQVVYVYNIATNLWSTMLVPEIKSILNGFPYPHVVLKNGTTIRLDKKQDAADDNQSHYGVIVTRPLKFEGAHKTVKAFDQSHSLATKPMMFIYGSNDLRKWHYIGKSNQQRFSYLPGSTWRYFRLALFLDMKTADRFYCTHLEVVEKYQKL